MSKESRDQKRAEKERVKKVMKAKAVRVSNQLAAGRATAPRRNHEDNEEGVQIHKK